MPDTIRSTSTPEVHSQTVVNPDGSNIGDALPTSGNNASTALSYDVNGDLQYIDETIDGTVYRTTLTYTDRVLVGISSAVAQ